MALSTATTHHEVCVIRSNEPQSTAMTVYHFIVEFAGRCDRCDQPYQPGDKVTATGHGITHPDCQRTNPTPAGNTATATH